MGEGDGYRVELDSFAGPLDLLLHLIKKHEVEIEEIPISEITQDFLASLEGIDDLDVNRAGEFLVMASTLMMIKSRSILPRSESEDEEEDEDDPRSELVRQLLEYRRFRDLAETLRDRAEDEGLSFPRGMPDDGPEAEEGEEEEIEVDLWQLVRAFARVLDETGANREQVFVYDEKPIAEHIAQIRTRLTRQSRFAFGTLFESGSSRSERIGLFLALLQLIQLQEIVVVQEVSLGTIEIRGKPPA